MTGETPQASHKDHLVQVFRLLLPGGATLSAPEELRRMIEQSKEYKLPVANIFHTGDGNLLPLIQFAANQPDELERTEAFGRRILELCVEVGDTINGEHDVGMAKIDQMCVQFQATELDQFHGVKNAFDPEGQLKPGKAVSTLHRCAELGAMHVHHGQLPYPQLSQQPHDNKAETLEGCQPDVIATANADCQMYLESGAYIQLATGLNYWKVSLHSLKHKGRAPHTLQQTSYILERRNKI